MEETIKNDVQSSTQPRRATWRTIPERNINAVAVWGNLRIAPTWVGF